MFELRYSWKPVMSLIQRFWEHRVVRVFRLVAADTCIGLVIIEALQIVFWELKRLEYAGYPAERLDYFERIHFCSTLCCFGLYSVNLVIRLAVEVYREGYK
jgi:hypothetical protein